MWYQAYANRKVGIRELKNSIIKTDTAILSNGDVIKCNSERSFVTEDKEQARQWLIDKLEFQIECNRSTEKRLLKTLAMVKEL